MLRIRNTFWLKTVKLKISHGFEYQNDGCRCWILGFFGDQFFGIACTLEAETSVSKLTQYKLFIGDDKKIRFLEWPSPLRNRKHFPCFYRVIETRVEVWENEKCCGNTSHRRVFPQLFRVLPKLYECFYNSIELRRKCFLFLLKNSPRKKTKNEENLIVLFIIKT